MLGVWRQMSGFRIGELARLAGVPVDTIRYYERTGLIAPPPRTASGYRAYPSEALARLQMVRRAKELGFTLAEIGELLDLYDNRDSPCRHLHCKAVAKLDEIEGRILELHRIKDELRSLVGGCSPTTPIHECPVLKTLAPAGGIAALLTTVTDTP